MAFCSVNIILYCNIILLESYINRMSFQEYNYVVSVYKLHSHHIIYIYYKTKTFDQYLTFFFFYTFLGVAM